MDPDQVPHLLLRPGLHHLPRVLLAVPLAESEFSAHVSVAIFKHEDAGLEDLDCHAHGVLVWSPDTVIHVGLLARGDAAVNLRHEAPVEQLEEDHPGAGVHHLLHRRPVRLVPHPPRAPLLHVVLPNVNLAGELLQNFLIWLIVTQLSFGHLLIWIVPRPPFLNVKVIITVIIVAEFLVLSVVTRWSVLVQIQLIVDCDLNIVDVLFLINIIKLPGHRITHRHDLEI